MNKKPPRLGSSGGLVTWLDARRLGTLCLGVLLLYGCHRTPGAADAGAAADAKPSADAKGAKPEASAGITLTAEQRDKMGLGTEVHKAADFTPEIAGFGVVVTHETVAQSVAELISAEAMARQSDAALARSRRLSGTPGAVSADVAESNQRQAAVDAAALGLAKEKLSSIVGRNPPWKDGQRRTMLQEISDGSVKLLRVTFPLGALTGPPPKSLRAAPIGASAAEARWKITAVWAAPADASVPGRSFFALLRADDAAEGERLSAWAPHGAPQAGVIIPAAAAVISDGKYWCYVEKAPGTYVRTEVGVANPVAAGYFVAAGFAAGDKVVTAGAGQLLAQELNSGPEPD